MTNLRFRVPNVVILLLLLIVDDAALATEEKVRMVTREELAMHDGRDDRPIWLSIMSKVFDVSAGPEYYAEGSTYRIFAGRDGNVPFITGAFDPEEAQKPLTDLTNNQLMNLEIWSQFYVDEEKYPFIGHLVGELYDEEGNPTETMGLVQEKIAEEKIEAVERKRKIAELLDKRARDDAAKLEAEKQQGRSWNPKAKPDQPRGNAEL